MPLCSNFFRKLFKLIPVWLLYFREGAVVPFELVRIIGMSRVEALIIGSEVLRQRQVQLLHSFDDTFRDFVGSIRIEMGIVG